MPPPITMRSPDGSVVEVPDDQVAVFADRGFTVEDAVTRTNRVADSAREEFYSSPSNKVRAAYAGVARGATFGASDAVARAVGAEDTLRGLREANPITSGVAELGGSLITGKLPGVSAVGRAGAAVAKTAEGASTLTKLGRAAAGAALEGAAYGAGSGISDVSLSADPLTLEQAISTVGSHAFFGGAVGGAAGLLAKGVTELGRTAANKLDDVAAKTATAPVDDAARQAFVDDVTAFRKSSIDDELFAVVKGAPDRETKTIAKTWLEADKAVDRVLRNPKALASEPKRVLTALQQQEHALETIANKADDMRATLSRDTETVSEVAIGANGLPSTSSWERIKPAAQAKIDKLERIAPALEQNRALQTRIEALTAKPAEAATGGLGASMLGGQAFGLGASVVGAIPVIGPMLAPLAGAAASKLVTEGLGKMAAKQAARMSAAVKTFTNVAERAAPAAPVLASKVLSETMFADRRSSDSDAAVPKQRRMAASYKALTEEVKRLTEYDQTGRAVMRQDQRAQVFERLAPVRQHAPRIADQIETIVARRIEAIANRIPRRPDVMSMRVGPDRWQPSDLEMRALARYVSAVEDPASVFERVAAGTVTPEDAAAMKEVYPEMYADYQQQVFTQLPKLRKTLPYQKRLALSIFSGVPVDPAMAPQVLASLQAAYAAESKPTMPSPQFGSVKNHEATPSEQRQGVTS